MAGTNVLARFARRGLPAVHPTWLCVKRGCIMGYASELRIFGQIIVPLSMLAIAVFAILHFQFMWNNYLLPLLIMNRRQMFTLQVGIVNFQGEYRAEWNYMMAMVLVSIAPTIAIFLFFQRYFIRGIAMTGMKG